MINIIEPAADPLAHPLLRGMFAARKRVFVDLLGWQVPVRDGAYEIDQFDGARAQYVVLADPGGEHRASARLLPTRHPHILGTLFPGLCDGPVPSEDHVAEITRFCLDRRLSASLRRQARDRLVNALVDHARTRGIRAYTAIAGVAWAEQILAFGWRCRRLGVARAIRGEMLVALEITIEPDTAARLATGGIIKAPSRTVAA